VNKILHLASTTLHNSKADNKMLIGDEAAETDSVTMATA